MSTQLANTLGYYYLVFQGYPGAYAKCWVDGEENYTFLAKEDILQDTQKSSPNPSLFSQIEEALNDTYMYMWDVENEIIKKLRPAQNKDVIKDNLRSVLSDKKASLVDTQQISWDYNLDNLFKIR